MAKYRTMTQSYSKRKCELPTEEFTSRVLALMLWHRCMVPRPSASSSALPTCALAGQQFFSASQCARFRPRAFHPSPHTLCMYWSDRQNNRHRILIEDSDFGEDAAAMHASTSSFFAAASINRVVHGLHAPPASPRATDL